MFYLGFLGPMKLTARRNIAAILNNYRGSDMAIRNNGRGLQQDRIEPLLMNSFGLEVQGTVQAVFEVPSEKIIELARLRAMQIVREEDVMRVVMDALGMTEIREYMEKDLTRHIARIMYIIAKPA